MQNKNNLLKFKQGNAKLTKTIYTFSLPAGWSCPFADRCLSKSDKVTGKITDGKNTEFRCFAASMECRNPFVRQNRWNNFDLLKGKNREEMTRLILDSIPKKARFIRVHVSGDHFSRSYFEAWLNVANALPNVIFYGYTKAINYLIEYKNEIPSNFRFTASYGGIYDNLIAKHGLKSAVVVYSIKEAQDKGLEIDHDDSHAVANDNKSFALLIHGTQPPKTKASQAWQIIKKTIGGYKGKSDFGGSQNIRMGKANKIAA